MVLDLFQNIGLLLNDIKRQLKPQKSKELLLKKSYKDGLSFFSGTSINEENKNTSTKPVPR